MTSEPWPRSIKGQRGVLPEHVKVASLSIVCKIARMKTGLFVGQSDFSVAVDTYPWERCTMYTLGTNPCTATPRSPLVMSRGSK